MKTSTFLITLFAMVSVFAFLTWHRLRYDVEAELSAHAKSLVEELPIFYDTHTDLIGARADGKEMVYQFRVHGFTMQDMPLHREELLSEKILRAQADINFTRLLKSGARLSYEYFVGDELALRFSFDESAIDGGEPS